MGKNQPTLHVIKLPAILISPLFIYFSCKKPDVEKEMGEELQNTTVSAMGDPCDNLVCEDCTFQETIENDTTEYATVLGGTYSNPYSISTMTQAYNNIHGTISNQSVQPTIM